jgi:hypothetical protein
MCIAIKQGVLLPLPSWRGMKVRPNAVDMCLTVFVVKAYYSPLPLERGWG